MARTNFALYFDEIVDAFEVDDNYSTKNFKCQICHEKIQFNRGINHKDPHFKNWPKVEHLNNCAFNNNYKRFNKYNDQNVDKIVSTILPSAKRLTVINNQYPNRTIIERYFGRRSKEFLSALNMLDNDKINELTLITEYGNTVKLGDIILRQDEIIEKMKNENIEFICILKGYTSQIIEIKGSIKIPLTSNGKYKNKNKFDLFLPASYVEKNNIQLKNIENKLIFCYGVPEKNEYGYKMNVYSIEHQIFIQEKCKVDKK